MWRALVPRTHRCVGSRRELTPEGDIINIDHAAGRLEQLKALPVSLDPTLGASASAIIQITIDHVIHQAARLEDAFAIFEEILQRLSGNMFDHRDRENHVKRFVFDMIFAVADIAADNVSLDLLLCRTVARTFEAVDVG